MGPSEAFAVERLSPEDASLGARAVNAVKPEEERGGVPVTKTWMKTFLANDRNLLLVAHRDRDPLGFALGYILDRIDRAEPMLLFYEIGVRETSRRRGVARALVEHLKSICREKNVMKMWTQTDGVNLAAWALYRTSGGIEAGEGEFVFTWRDFD
jgi:ribosomal protein S18 acetylase RimI-like enzyme